MGNTKQGVDSSWPICGHLALLSTEKVDLDRRDLRGCTPLTYASRSGRYDNVKALIENGAVYTDSKDGFGRTLLSHAAEWGYSTIGSLLIFHGGDPD
ncbi:hypothetical protein BOTCAL_0692g00030 [Botryotinia calthae]|uniref:Uncharacterized protein n=1 Tax=Botryotinia calthae TaxID=38488 RepID=A0A4Y8CH92_9HELO|nr:hypothetical protein BOTCAL_0692g00030 [Botryotinia calthae]